MPLLARNDSYASCTIRAYWCNYSITFTDERRLSKSYTYEFLHLNLSCLLLTYFLAVDCGPLSVPTNGSSSGISTLFPNGVQFQCDPGFILNGSAIRTCQPNGKWSGFSTVCSGRYEANVNKNENGSCIRVLFGYKRRCKLLIMLNVTSNKPVPCITTS